MASVTNETREYILNELPIKDGLAAVELAFARWGIDLEEQAETKRKFKEASGKE